MSARARRARLVVYANTITRTETDDATGEEVERDIPFLKGYTVFNVEQIDGLPAHYYAQAEPVLDPGAAHRRTPKRSSPRPAPTSATAATAPSTPSADYIQMPPFEAFRDAESYYATLAHEATHWTAPHDAP